MRSVCNHHSKILQHHRIITGSHTHTYDVCDPFVIITPRFYNIIASSSERSHTHTHIRRMRSVCNHHSKILQHHRIRDRKHTQCSHMSIRRMRSVCNHHSKILQHHRIITRSHTHKHTRIRRMRSARRTKNCAISPPRLNERVGTREYSNSGKVWHMDLNHCSVHVKLAWIWVLAYANSFVQVWGEIAQFFCSLHCIMRSVCNHHSTILQHSRIRIANKHTQTHTHTTYAILL